MARPKLPYGSWGEISCKRVGPSRYKARARFRDATGKTTQIARYGQTITDAKNRLREALVDEQATVQSTQVHRTSTVRELADLWLATGGGTRKWSTNTAETYRHVVRNQIKPQLGDTLVAELSPPRVSAAIERILAQSGPGAAKTAKTALTGMVKLAIRHGALRDNPVRDAISVPRKRKSGPRALTRDEAEDLTDKLRSDPRAVELDLPDLVDWMLGTGARIGEAIAARGAVIDRDAGTWEIDSTLVRVRGAGLAIQLRPKTEAGHRLLALPSYLLAMIDRRAGELRFQTETVQFIDETGRIWSEPGRVLFPAPLARKLRDPSNTAGDLREVLDGIGYGWVTGHTFRKTVATRLDEAGLERVVSDQLGHSRRSMTLDHYIGRRLVSTEAAKILDR